MLIPRRLQPGDEIRVIAPSRSLSIVHSDIFENACAHLHHAGYRITFAEHSRKIEYADSASIQSRIDDLHRAFLDSNVSAILTAIGGFNANQLLDSIDYSIIRANPKILCGYSDITALLNAIHAQTGLVTYHGPHFSSFGFDLERDYTDRFFHQCVASDAPFSFCPSGQAQSYTVLQEGVCEGTIIGGNLCTLNLLQGTDYMPDLTDVILFLEDDNIMGPYFPYEFDRNLHSLLQVKNSRIRGVVFGRFAEDCGLTPETIRRIIRTKRQLRHIPILFGADFGHVFPFFTFPIGGTARLAATGSHAEITVLSH